MCGIAGIIHFSSQKADKKELKKMCDAIAHRGPDAEGFYLNKNVAFGHRRLAIRDLSPLGQQPMFSNDKTIAMVFNGEIYNDSFIKQKLENEHGIQFKSACDSEMICPAYRAHGIDIVKELEGMFSIALHDQSSDTVYLVRDPIGIKPLYYFKNESTLLFGSELKALLAHSECEKEINPDSLHSYFAQGYVDPNSSLIKNIHQVAPGSFIKINVKTGAIEEHKFWTPKRTNTIKNIHEAHEEFAKLWPKVLDDMLISDVPIGVLQSGGIDSSLISTSLPRDKNVPLFTAAFKEKSHDESHLAQLIASNTGHPLTLLTIDDHDNLEASVRKVIHHYDGQVTDSSGLAFYNLCAEVRKHVTVALTGDGGDEFFGGYSTYKASKVAKHISPFMPSFFAKQGEKLGHFLNRGKASRLPFGEILSRFMAGVAESHIHPHTQWRRIMSHNMQAHLYDDSMKTSALFSPLSHYNHDLTSQSGIDEYLLSDQTHYLPGDLLMKSDAMSMAHSLEIRVPFLDKRIMTFAGQLSSDLLTPFFGEKKRFLRHALKQHQVGNAIINAPKKGFNVPLVSLFSDQLKPLGHEYFLEKKELFSPWLKENKIEQIWLDHCAQKANHGYLLWTLLNFAIWRETL